MTFTHSFNETMSEMVIITSWMIPPPPIPWMALHTINQVMFCAAPHIAEPNCEQTDEA